MSVKGSSPLTRGKRHEGVHGCLDEGLIPAHAGKTMPPRSPRRPARAHPRSRGENRARPGCPSTGAGSSPLTRGKRVRPPCTRCRYGLIPAHAGKTRTSRLYSYTVRAHPRSRGENVKRVLVDWVLSGSSPLTRGKRHGPRPPDQRGGLIPAHAGKTRGAPVRRRRGPAHPRSRGENVVLQEGGEADQGSSPLTRGKHVSFHP